MHVASKELCEELYELSRWLPEEYLEDGAYADLRWWINFPSGTFQVGHQLQPSFAHREIVCPAYDLGYLLRKLPNYPPKGPADTNYYDQLFIAKVGNKYEAYYFNRITHRRAGNALADTPEDAACKLAIELIKQGIMKP